MGEEGRRHGTILTSLFLSGCYVVGMAMRDCSTATRRASNSYLCFDIKKYLYMERCMFIWICFEKQIVVPNAIFVCWKLSSSEVNDVSLLRLFSCLSPA